MNPNQLDGLVFSREEMLVLFDAVDAPSLIGIDQSELIPETDAAHIAAIQSGIEALIGRDLMHKQDDLHVLNRELFVMAGVVARPEVVTLGVRNEAEGSRQFIWYQAANMIIEFTKPTVDRYRLAVLPSGTALINRIQFLFPIMANSDNEPITFELPKTAFFELNNLISQGELESARGLLVKLGVDEESYASLVKEMQNPVYSGNLTMMGVTAGQITDGRDIAILGGAADSWVIVPNRANPERFQCSKVNDALFVGQLFDALLDVSKAPTS